MRRWKDAMRRLCIERVSNFISSSSKNSFLHAHADIFYCTESSASLGGRNDKRDGGKIVSDRGERKITPESFKEEAKCEVGGRRYRQDTDVTEGEKIIRAADNRARKIKTAERKGRRNAKVTLDLAFIGEKHGEEWKRPIAIKKST